MDPQKRQIHFNKSMTANKRHADFAYLRNNVLNSDTPGLYPARDFLQEEPIWPLTNVDPIPKAILGSESSSFKRKVIASLGPNSVYVDYGTTSFDGTITGAVFKVGTFGSDGVYALFDDDTIYRLDEGSPTSLHLLGGVNVRVAGFDGLDYYWVSDTEIFRQAPGGAAVSVFTDVGIEPEFIGFHNENMAIFGQVGDDIYTFIWDKQNNTLFEKRIITKNARLLAGGVLHGKLILIKSVGNRTNRKEREGEIIVSHYNGEFFEKVNSIKAGDDKVTKNKNTCFDVGDEFAYLAIRRNANQASHQPELYQNWVLKIGKDGSIETVYIQPANEVGMICQIHVTYDSLVLLTEEDTGSVTNAMLLEDRDDSIGYGVYDNFTTTKYITNFLNNAFNKHILKGMQIVFEKLHDDEELVVSYRVSDRDDFVVLDTINQATLESADTMYDPALKTAERANITLGINQQIYSIVDYPETDDRNLPEFNEIQFKFESSNGFSVIQAWYSYEYIDRNTMG